jgi:tetratricopeptide (TPR) repeat protein
MKRYLPCVISLLFALGGKAQSLITSKSGDLAGTYQHIGILLSDNHVRSAEKIFSRVIDVYRAEQKSEALSEQYFGMALALAFNGHYRKSIAYHKKALRAHKKFRSTEPDEIVFNLGLTYYLAGKMRKAKVILGDTFDVLASDK